MGQEQRPRSRVWIGYLAASGILAAIATCSGILVVLNTFSVCDVSVAIGFDLLWFLMLSPGLAIICAAPLFSVYMLLDRWRISAPVRAGLAVLATVAIIAALSWLFFVRNGLPLRNMWCPGGSPPWWPDWLPPSHHNYP